MSDQLPAVIPVAAVVLHQAEVDAVIVDLWIGHHRSPHTVRNYRRQAAAFLAYVGKPLAQVRVSDLQGYLGTLEGLAPATRANATAAVKSLLSYAHRAELVPHNAGSVVQAPAVRNVLSERILDRDDVSRMLALETGPRNKVVLTLLYAAGLRISEVCGLRWCNLQVRDDAGQITIVGKGETTRVVLLSKRTWTMLVELQGASGPQDAVFRSRKGGGNLDPSMVHRIVKATAERAGLSAEISAHWLRHAHASHSLDRGAPIHLVMATLGHASVATTGRYLHARPTDSSARYLGV